MLIVKQAPLHGAYPIHLLAMYWSVLLERKVTDDEAHEILMRLIAPIPIPAPGVTLVYRDGRWQPADPDYIKSILAVDPPRRRALREGSWDTTGPTLREFGERAAPDDAYDATLTFEGVSGDPTSDS